MTQANTMYTALTLSSIPGEEEVGIGKAKYRGTRIKAGHTVNIDGRTLIGLDNALVIGDKNRCIIILDGLAKSILIGDIVKLRRNYYVVQDTVPANTAVSPKYKGHKFSMRPEKRQTYLVARDGEWLRVPASEVSEILPRTPQYKES